jgi:hypothetical protein
MRLTILIATALAGVAGAISQRPFGSVLASGIIIGYAIALWGMHHYYG